MYFQVRFLQEQARKVLEDARLNALVHKTNCNFKKIPGKTYYIYKQKKNPDEEFMSMISPEEWGDSGPEFVGGYKLEYDMSWTELQVRLGILSLQEREIIMTFICQDIERKQNETALINKILDTNTSDLKFSFLPSQYQASRMLESKTDTT